MTTNLSGSLDAFGLDEVLSLLGMGGRTAHLQVRSTAGVGSVHLVDGEVSSATADCARAGLLRQVVAAASVPASDLARALEEGDPVRALVDSGAVDRDQARGLAAEHLVDAMGELLAWRDGEFAVSVGEEDPGDIGVRFPVRELVDRGRERVEQWDRVRAALPEPHSVLSVVPAQAESPTLATDEWAVLARIDGRRTLAEVVAAAGCAPLVASDRLAGLIGRGLVAVRDPEAEVEPDEIARLVDRFERPEATHALSDAIGPEEPDAVEVATSVVVAVEPDVVEPVVVDPVPVDQVAIDPVAVEQVEDLAPAPVEPVLFAEPVHAAEPSAPEEPVAEAEVAGAVPPVVEPIPVVLDGPVAEAASWSVDAEPTAEPPVDVAAAPGDAHRSEPGDVPAAPAAAEEPTQVRPMAPAVEWSPWAQALGLAAPAPAGELVVDPLAGRGIAQLIADAAGLQEVEHVPVPLPPVTDDSWGDPGAAYDVDEEPVEPLVHDLDVPVPGPRLPGDAVASESALPPVPAAPQGEPGDPADPLAGGLLAQLISGVRGL